MLSRPVLVYDGRCGACRGWVEWLRRRGAAEAFEYLPAEARQGHAGLPPIGDAQVDREMVLVMPDGRVLGGGAALPELARRVPGFRFLAPLLTLPGVVALRDAGYRWVAARRQRDPCDLPAPTLRSP